MRAFIPLRNVLGVIETWSMFQAYKKKDAQAAHELLLSTQNR